MTDPTVAVLDIDGTLIDSNYQHALAWHRALRSVGEIYPVWRLHRLIGMGGDQVVTAVGVRTWSAGRAIWAPPGVSSVMVGDSVWDVEAAKRAGMPAIVIRSGGFGDDELRAAGAIAIDDTPGDLAKALGDTPLA